MKLLIKTRKRHKMLTKLIRLLPAIPLLLLQSCFLQPDRSALICEVSYEGEENKGIKEKFIIVVDYAKQTFTMVSEDGDATWNLFNPKISPNKLIYQNPLMVNAGIPDPNSFTEIDRSTLTLSVSGEPPGKGICKKTSVPDLSAKGKQI